MLKQLKQLLNKLSPMPCLVLPGKTAASGVSVQFFTPWSVLQRGKQRSHHKSRWSGQGGREDFSGKDSHNMYVYLSFQLLVGKHLIVDNVIKSYVLVLNYKLA